MKRGLVIIAVLSLISAIVVSYYDRGWEPGPIEIAEDIRARACRGELAGFNEYIDKQAVEYALKRSELERLRKDFLYSTRKKQRGDADVRDLIVNTVPELLSHKWQLFNDQVMAGGFGPICNMELVKVGKNGSEVKIKFPGGERSTWGFGKVGQKWKLVSIQDVTPLRASSLKLVQRTTLNNTSVSVSSEAVKESPDLSDKESARLHIRDEDSEEQVRDTEGAPALKVKADKNNLPQGTKKPDTALIEDAPERSKERAAVSSGYDFRNTRWGMTPGQVAKAEGREPGTKSPGELVYNTYYKGESVKVRYKFTANVLKSGGVVFLNDHPEEIFYVQDFEMRKGDLTSQYGEPLIDEEIWYNRLYEDVPERMGFAVAIGHLKLRTKWRTESSDILLELKSEDYNMTLVLSFHSR